MTETAHAVATQRFAPGSLVAARGREWVVLPDSEPDMLVLRPLGGADDDVAAVFPDLEPVAQASFPPPDPGDLGDALAAGLLRTALRIGFRSSAGPFRSLASIAVEPRPYQLVPLLMAMRQDTVRMAICDDVGIGKTIESGLIAAELRAQGEAKGLAVLCSPALAEQWQGELRTKFGINAELILASTAPRLERALAYGESLFSRHQTVVISTDFIKSPRHRDDFIDHCPDLVIVDEAHTCVPADAGASAKSAQLRYELLTRLARNERRHLLLVTATPHSGKDESFRALIGLLNPQLAAADLTSDAGRTRLARHYVQRRRLDIRRQYPDEAGAFPGDRIFGDAPYTLSPGYRALLDDAIAYASERVTAAGTVGRREQRVAWWSAIALLRSLVSSPRAAAQTLLTRSQAAAAATADEADILGRPVTADMADDSFDGIDASPGADDGGTAAAPRDARLAELAGRAAALEGPEHDKKLALLIKTVKQLLADGYHPIVFCRYIPTSEYLAEQLDGKLGRKTIVTSVNGTLSPAQRLDRIDRLAEAAEQEDGARRVLVATDCLSEGVNLQHHFNAVIHYDLAWNPTRHEQREGRVDRFGQRSEDVRVVTIYGGDNGIDGKVLEVLIRKHREIRKLTGISVPIPDETSSQVTDAIMEWLLMRGQASTDQQALFELDEVIGKTGGELDVQWRSMADREDRSRSRFAQGTIHPYEVAAEAAAIRAALGPDDEVRAFAKSALKALNADLATAPDGDGFTVTTSTLPPGLWDAIGALIGERRRLPFSVTPAVPRGEASLTRTDPAVGAIAGYILANALDRHAPAALKPARRCGVIRTTAVSTRTTLLLVRYRYQLTLPGRYGNAALIAEDARVLGFEGAPASARWLPDDAATALLAAVPDQSTIPEFARNAITTILGGLDAVRPEVNHRAQEFAAELRDAHRRVRRTADQAVRGLTVTPAGDADILGVYVYLPATPQIQGAGQ
ncbi:MAG TPA: helicase-related protein [Streptosporangiaceae bacterium]|nr:helicase-related protein [Streptosporangiaceae bacterium]